MRRYKVASEILFFDRYVFLRVIFYVTLEVNFVRRRNVALKECIIQ